MPKTSEIFEKIGDNWPYNEPLDYGELPIANLYAQTFIDVDAQASKDWMSRVEDNYPELYFSMNMSVRPSTE